jgi:type II secretory pathway component GspD/PulD (secretin)
MSSRIPILAMLVAACLFLTSTPAQAAKTKMKSRSYPVGQILNPDREDKQAATPQQLIDLITGTIQPSSWRQNGGHASIAYVPEARMLVVNQSAAVHDEIENLLLALAKLMDLQVVLEFRLLTISEACFERLGINLEPVQPADSPMPPLSCPIWFAPAPPPAKAEDIATPPLSKAFLTDSQVRELMEAAQGDRRSCLMQSPKLTILNGQAGTVNVAETQFYVTSLQMECKDGQVICTPKQEAFQLGTFFTVLPTVSADRKSVRVNLKFKQTELAGPVPLIPVQFPMKQDKAQPELLTLFLQQPQVSTLAIDNTTVIPEGQTLLLGGIKKLAEERNEFGPPILSKIPYLNRFFKNVGYGRETVSLVIMVTPRIVVREESQ